LIRRPRLLMTWEENYWLALESILINVQFAIQIESSLNRSSISLQKGGVADFSCWLIFADVRLSSSLFNARNKPIVIKA